MRGADHQPALKVAFDGPILKIQLALKSPGQKHHRLFYGSKRKTEEFPVVHVFLPLRTGNAEEMSTF